MAHELHFTSSLISAVHQQNLLNSLTSRLEAAKVAGNAQLIKLLEQEKRQLTAPHPRLSAWQTLQSGVKSAQQRINKMLFGGSTLQVSEFDADGNHWWYAVNPLTGDCVYADSESELRLWIEKNYQEN